MTNRSYNMNGEENIRANLSENFNDTNFVASKNLYPPSALYKSICIDFYLKKYKCQLITSEFRYGILQMVTDLAIITPRNTISIEIKTEQDDLRRLHSQIIESRKNFNLTIVFAASQYTHELLSILPPDVGITILENENCKIVRTPKRNEPLNLELVASIPAVYLRSYFKVPGNLDSDKTRAYVLTKYSYHVHECFRAFMKYKFSKNYNQFLSDRGEKTHIDDIPTLTMKNIIEIR